MLLCHAWPRCTCQGGCDSPLAAGLCTSSHRHSSCNAFFLQQLHVQVTLTCVVVQFWSVSPACTSPCSVGTKPLHMQPSRTLPPWWLGNYRGVAGQPADKPCKRVLATTYPMSAWQFAFIQQAAQEMNVTVNISRKAACPQPPRGTGGNSLFSIEWTCNAKGLITDLVLHVRAASGGLPKSLALLNATLTALYISCDCPVCCFQPCPVPELFSSGTPWPAEWSQLTRLLSLTVMSCPNWQIVPPSSLPRSINSLSMGILGFIGACCPFPLQQACQWRW